MRIWKKGVLVLAVEVAVLLALHTALIHWLAENNVVAAIFAAGPHVPRLTLGLAGVFVLVRLLAVLCLPGVVLSRLGMAVLSRLVKRRDARAPKV